MCFVLPTTYNNVIMEVQQRIASTNLKEMDIQIRPSFAYGYLHRAERPIRDQVDIVQEGQHLWLENPTYAGTNASPPLSEFVSPPLQTDLPSFRHDLQNMHLGRIHVHVSHDRVVKEHWCQFCKSFIDRKHETYAWRRNYDSNGNDGQHKEKGKIWGHWRCLRYLVFLPGDHANGQRFPKEEYHAYLDTQVKDDGLF